MKEHHPKENLPSDLYQQVSVAQFGCGAILMSGLYLTRAIELAHRGKVSKENFWRNLFVTTGYGHYILDSDRGFDPDSPGEDPYGELDFQACNKYLLHGWKRIHNGGWNDGVHFYKKFRQDAKDDAYKSVLGDAIKLRNRYMHSTCNSLHELSAERVRDDMETLKDLLQPVQNLQNTDKVSLPGLPTLKEFWAEMDGQLVTLFGSVPIPVAELEARLFCTVEGQELSVEDRDALHKAFAICNLSVRDGYIYNEISPEAVLEKLCLTLPLLDKNPTGEEIEQKLQQLRQNRREQEEKEYTGPEVALWTPVTVEDAPEAIFFDRQTITLNEKAVRLLLKHFYLLASETPFLEDAGRSVLTEQFLPVLRQDDGYHLIVDTAATGALFRAFENSRDYTEEELAELRRSDGLPEEMIRELQETRSQLHEASRAALNKTLRRLKKYDCLDIVESILDPRCSARNIRRLAEEHPEELFLVLTGAEEAELFRGIYSRNLVAVGAQRSPEGELRLRVHEATRNNWVDIMGLGRDDLPPDEDPRDGEGLPLSDGEEPSAPECPSEEIQEAVDELLEQSAPTAMEEPVREATPPTAQEEPLPVLPFTAEEFCGDRVMLLRSGQWITLQLGRLLGEGGEGAVYEIAGPTEYSGNAAKIYKKDRQTAERLEKLNYMLRHDPKQDGLCWPQELLYSREDTQGWVGFLMPMAAGEALDEMIYRPGANAEGLVRRGWKRRDLARTAANLADGFVRMHRSGILMGDISPKNILVDKDGAVCFVDCDSYQVGRFECPVGTIKYTPPEVLRQTGGEENIPRFRHEEIHESYSLAVLLFEILMLGKAPYVSCNGKAEDVVNAIIRADFPYPYNNRSAEEEDADWINALQADYRSRGVLPPGGIYRLIWSHFPSWIKEAFFETFTGPETGRRSPDAWRRLMNSYYAELCSGKRNDMLIPFEYLIPQGMDREQVTCVTCGREFELAADELQRRRERGTAILCPECKHYQDSEERMWVAGVCDSCGTWCADQVKYARIRHLCEKCRTEHTTCEHCGERFETDAREREYRGVEDRYWVDLCLSCRKEKVTFTCSDCGGEDEIGVRRYEQLKREGKGILCEPCRKKRQFRSGGERRYV